ncbi:MAG: methyltransferase family protein [Chitinophagales bacterium]
MENKSLKIKAISGLIFLILLEGVFLFGSAGTFDYWQAWTWILVFGGSSAWITFSLMKNDMELLKRRLGGGPEGEKEPVQKTIVGLARIIFIGIIVLPGIDHRFGWSRVPSLLSISGDVFGVIGFYIVYLVFRENSFTSAIVEIADDQKVISTGPYRIVRHPMYSGALLMIVFAPIALGSFWGLALVIPFIGLIVWRLIEEEKFLQQQLPGYSDYSRRTIYRLVPGIW